MNFCPGARRRGGAPRGPTRPTTWRVDGSETSATPNGCPPCTGTVRAKVCGGQERRAPPIVVKQARQQKKKIFSGRRLASPSPRAWSMNPQIRNADKELKKGDSNCEKARQIRLSSSLGLRWFPPIFFVSRLTGWSVLGGHRCRSVPTAPRSDSMRSYRLEGASRRRAANRSLRAGPRWAPHLASLVISIRLTTTGRPMDLPL